MSGERAHAAAIKSLITATTAALPAYDYDEAASLEKAGGLPDRYVLVTVTRRAGSPTRMSGGRALLGWRLTTTEVGRTTDESRWVTERVALLDDKPIAALSSSALRLESSQAPESDDGRYTAVTVRTYNAPV